MVTRDEITEPPTEVDTVKEIGRGFVTNASGWTVGCGTVSPADAPVGSLVEYWGEFGQRVRGLCVNGIVVWYRTEAEEQALANEERVKYKLNKRQEYEAERPELDAKYAALPPEFQARLDRFRTANPEFRWEFEAYEMSCCVDAVKIAEHCDKDPDAIVALAKADYPEQRAAGLSDQHSGNSASVTFRLAYLWAHRPELVQWEHGALTAMVGCAEYGCSPHMAQVEEPG